MMWDMSSIGALFLLIILGLIFSIAYIMVIYINKEQSKVNTKTTTLKHGSES